MSKRLHIVSFDNPYPPNYGGVIDVYYKIKQLYKMGVEVILHAYEYGRPPQAAIEEYCHAVYYYPRVAKIMFGTPYIVSSRSSSELLKNLCKDKAPILFEGLHTCYHLDNDLLKNRIKIVRMHNIEHHYYAKLAHSTTHLFKKIYFNIEAMLLKKYEQKLEYASVVYAISPNDYSYLKSRFNHTVHLPPFHANNEVSSITGVGNYAFYHGNLSVAENDEAARYLVEHVFAHTTYPLIIAGSNPTNKLIKLANKYTHISVLHTLTTEEIATHIRYAHINIIPTFQSTGIKLKLLNVLYQGRHVMVNQLMVDNTGCESLCTICNTPAEMIDGIASIMNIPFDEKMLAKRRKVLQSLFNNETSASIIMHAIE
jgi:hypothetical protein